MRASVVLRVLGLATAVVAQTTGFDPLISPPTQSSYKVGDKLPIQWTPTSPVGKITLTLIGGSSSSDLAPVVVIASSIDSTLATFSWPIPPNVGSFASYGVNLTLDAGGDFQYSSQFFITGGSFSSSSSSSASTTTSTVTVSTPSSTATVTVSSSVSSRTQTPSFSNSTTTSPTKKGSSTATVASTSSTSSPSASNTPSAADTLRLGSAGLMGAGVVMALLL